MNLEQNLFKLDSRGTAIVPLQGSRPTGAVVRFLMPVIKIKSITMLGAKGADVDVKFAVSDTRMQLFLPKEVAANGGKVKLKIEYSFVAP